jgi:hypothetical protein
MNELAQVEPWWMAGWPKHVSPSGLGRVAACVRSEAMPHASSSSPFANKGTVAHKYLADCLEVGRELALGRVEDPADIDWLASIDIEQLPAFDPLAYSPEIAFAYDPRTRTARELGRNISREEARRRAEDHELVGIVDVGGCTDELVVAHDYKTGWGYVERAETNWQLRTYALMMARSYGKTGAFYSVIRVKDNGFIWSDRAQMDELDLLAHEDALIDLLQRRTFVRELARRGQWAQLPALNEGEHCRYCPAAFACPAKIHAVKEVAGGAELVPGVLSPEVAAVAWRKVRAAQKTLDRMESILRAYARQTPIPLGDGEILGEKLVSKESVVPDKAKVVLERQYGSLGLAVWDDATVKNESLPKDRLRKALQKLVLPTLPEEDQKITWLEKAVHKILREAGAMSTKTERQITEHVPPKLALPEGTPSEEAA